MEQGRKEEMEDAHIAGSFAGRDKGGVLMSKVGGEDERNGRN